MPNAELTGSAPGNGTPNPMPRAAEPLRRPRAAVERQVLDRHFDGSDLHQLRALVSDFVGRIATERVSETVVLLSHELCSNAVRHGGGSGRVRVWADAGTVYCQVMDEGAGLSDPDKAGRTLPPPTLPGGRGLWIARSMSELRIATGASGTTVTALVAR